MLGAAAPPADADSRAAIACAAAIACGRVPHGVPEDFGLKLNQDKALLRLANEHAKNIRGICCHCIHWTTPAINEE